MTRATAGATTDEDDVVAADVSRDDTRIDVDGQAIVATLLLGAALVGKGYVAAAACVRDVSVAVDDGDTGYGDVEFVAAVQIVGTQGSYCVKIDGDFACRDFGFSRAGRFRWGSTGNFRVLVADGTGVWLLGV